MLRLSPNLLFSFISSINAEVADYSFSVSSRDSCGFFVLANSLLTTAFAIQYIARTNDNANIAQLIAVCENISSTAPRTNLRIVITNIATSIPLLSTKMLIIQRNITAIVKIPIKTGQKFPYPYGIPLKYG